MLNGVDFVFLKDGVGFVDFKFLFGIEDMFLLLIVVMFFFVIVVKGVVIF